MKKIFLLFLIFLFFSAKAYEFKHSLLPEELPPKKIETFEYAPYAFLNYLNPIIASLMTFMGIGIFWRGKDGEPVHGGKTRPENLK